MLSILIPIYNFNVTNFVTELYKQAELEAIDYEIILIDDDSDISFTKINSVLKKYKTVKYIQLTENIGRSKIRNLLAEKAKFDYLLFADCDSEIPKKDYLKKYIKECKSDVVICGGRTYKENHIKKNTTFFRWYYGTKREVRSASERNVFANRSFMTNNYVISKSIHNTIKFDENISQYGHEDTLFGIELKRKNIIIKHIDNPLIHIGLEDCNYFIYKTRKGIDNLNYLINNYNYPELNEDIKLVKTFNKTKSVSLLFKLAFHLFKNIIKKNLCGKMPSLKLFDLYKLAYFHSIKKKEE